MNSIIQKDKKCFLCCTTMNLEEHHIFGGNPNRELSERYGLKVWLCHRHHNEPPNGVHFRKEYMDLLHEEGQTQFEIHYPNLNFREIFGKNYL